MIRGTDQPKAVNESSLDLIIFFNRCFLGRFIVDEKLKKKLNGLLKSNKDWPIIIEGDIKEEDFLNATFLPAKTPSAKLGIINNPIINRLSRI